MIMRYFPKLFCTRIKMTELAEYKPLEDKKTQKSDGFAQMIDFLITNNIIAGIVTAVAVGLLVYNKRNVG